MGGRSCFITSGAFVDTLTDRIHLGLGSFLSEPKHVARHIQLPAILLLRGQVLLHLVTFVQLPVSGSGCDVEHRLAVLVDSLEPPIREELVSVHLGLGHCRTYDLQ